jgi:hypothetical protein
MEDRMARWTRLIPALAASLVLAACGQGTTDTPFSPPAARYEGGGTSLGGNFTPPPGGDPTTAGTTSAGPMELPQDTTGRTGGTSLGGN